MMNKLFASWFIRYCLILGQRFVASYAASVPVASKIVTQCLDQVDLTKEELSRFQKGPDERIKLINDDGEFRRYGCFLACIMQKHGLMTGSTMQLDLDAMVEKIVESLDNDLDTALFIRKNIELCADTLQGVDDACEVALALKVCILKSMRDVL